MRYDCFVSNHTYDETIKIIPLNAETDFICDVSSLLYFHLWELLLFNAEDTFFTRITSEEIGSL